MKNTIKYFYNLSIKDFIKYKDNYKITADSNYYLVLIDTDASKFDYIYKYFRYYNIYCHEIIMNKDNKMITRIDNKDYILLKVHIDNKKIDINDINNFQIALNKNTCNWYYLWTEKLDYYEYQMSQYKKKYPLLYISFSYYNGLCENAIELVNTISKEKIDMYVNHKRITKSYDYLEFYNPVNFILDIRVRDIVEYYKTMFFYKRNPIEEVIYYLNNNIYNQYEAILFFGRMLYPSYYFDLYDLIIQEKEPEEKMEIILKKTNDYEVFLREIYLNLLYKYNIPEIEWLIKT